MCVICGMNKKVEIKVSAIPYIDNENVCSDCVGDMIAFSLIQIENEKNYPFKDCKEKKLNILTPREIKAELDKRVIGQEDAKKTIAVAIEFNCQPDCCFSFGCAVGNADSDAVHRSDSAAGCSRFYHHLADCELNIDSVGNYAGAVLYPIHLCSRETDRAFAERSLRRASEHQFLCRFDPVLLRKNRKAILFHLAGRNLRACGCRISYPREEKIRRRLYPHIRVRSGYGLVSAGADGHAPDGNLSQTNISRTDRGCQQGRKPVNTVLRRQRTLQRRCYR